MTIIWPGKPGATFQNTTDKILYQLICSWINTCGTCAQYHLAVAKWWPKFHHGCNCESRPIYPNAKSAPYEDWREIIAGLPPDQQDKVVGKSVKQLIDAGVVTWSDVVTSNRVKLLREIVSIKQLSISDMTGAGVKQWFAENAWSTVNTTAHVIAERQRSQLLKQILDLGIQPQHVQEIFGESMAQRIGIGGGPSGASEIPPGKTDAQWIEILMRSFRPGPTPPLPQPVPQPTPTPKPEPTPQPQPLPQTVEDFAREVTIAANTVPLDLRYSDTKVWIIDAFAEFKKTYPDATLAQFKKDLAAANIERLITLARFDLPGQVSKETRKKDDDSETRQGVATFNQIRLLKP